MESHNRGCLLLHGFTGGPYELMPLAEHLEQTLGMQCRTPVLPGHDQDLAVLGGVTFHDWLDSASWEAHQLTKDCASVDVIGFSMGGLIAACLANRFPIRRLVLLNAAAIYISPVRLLAYMASLLLIRDWANLGRAKNVPPQATVEFLKLARHTKKRELPRIQVPTLIVQGAQDPIVHPRSGRYIYKRLKGERELRMFPQSRHMICLDREAPELFAEVERFLNCP
ncbi:alpha/beta hydrolase [Paenibacillus allorhizosphaerae]|uniref:Thermostable monoacylglycerol lipase n=1 Tax=Paenibacillus allorhizosphaerae TaxID=2849866 RepID=A0ABM8VLB9_9BACL|nr:alpha/beta fold hydrolase [Paenibacillus allorhizosphaerae]CAG7648388.1 Thermostable monoacylglycerol lipase [Paenibacillus allorhizosphaerae]